jgi:hypothetical protein
MPVDMGYGGDYSGGFGDGPTPSHFTRFDLFYPERNLELTVFPHGWNGSYPDHIAKAASRAALQREHVWSGHVGSEVSANRILSVNPWNALATQMPEGYYPNATGSTKFGAVCYKKPKVRGLLEISYVAWRFFEAADFSTSIVLKIVPIGPETQQVVAALMTPARKIAATLKTMLQATPPDPAAILLRAHLPKPG